MERIIVKLANSLERSEMLEWLRTTKDGELFDLDVLEHQQTFTLCAVGSESGRMAYLPVQQPMMLENLIFRPGLNERATAAAIAKLAEQSAVEAYRKDAGELYFLCRDESTCKFAERHGFKLLPDFLKVYRLNLLETFGA